jgi:hypothetical protein
MPSLPVGIALHCMALINSTAAIVMGGNKGDWTNSKNTHIFSSVNQEWSNGPALNQNKDVCVCGQIRANGQSPKTSVIVIDAKNLSVEVLGEGETEWKFGPELPFSIGLTVLIEDESNGIYLIGGLSAELGILDKILYLPHAEANWQELPQKLKTKRHLHTAFFVPDEITNCDSI